MGKRAGPARLYRPAIGWLVAVAGIVAAAAASAGGLEDLERYYREVQTLEGSFEQFTVDEDGRVVDQSSGEFVIRRPDRFHWSYAAPFSQEIVADGERLWVYEVDLDQVTVRPQQPALGSAPAQLLAGEYEDLERAFEIEPMFGFLRLVPRDRDQAFEEARLGLEDGTPTAVEVDDALGQTTRVEFSNLRINESVDEERFRFEPPDGVDVYEPSSMNSGVSGAR